MTADGNVGVAFALVIGAGASTALGASVVFFPALVKLASPRVLAGALGLSAGVMTYVSFAEIFVKSQDSFVDAGHTEENAYLYATLCFFGGVVFMTVLNVVVKMLMGGHHHHHHHHHDHKETAASSSDDSCGVGNEATAPTRQCCDNDPSRKLAEYHGMAAELEARDKQNDENDNGDDSKDEELSAKDTAATPNDSAAATAAAKRRLVHMGANTAVAIALHNFPEGLATFVAALNDPAVGAVLAIAIGIHNIPEGLCVALPIYYATGNRLKAFCWALISGVSEPFAALLGWAVLAGSFSDGLFAVLFGMVAGMMVIISVRELIPTAHNYDPEDSVVTFSFMAGMGIMALSLVLFVI